MVSINEYVLRASQMIEEVCIFDFIKDVYTRFYKNKQFISDEFIRFFVDILNNDDEFKIHYFELLKFGVLNTINLKEVRKTLSKYNLYEGTDFEIIKLHEYESTDHTLKFKEHYYLSVNAFKICLQKVQKNKEINHYDNYQVLETIYTYYKEYKRLHSINIVKVKDTKIEKLTKKIERLEDILSKFIAHSEERHIALFDDISTNSDKIDDNSCKLDEIMVRLHIPNPIDE